MKKNLKIALGLVLVLLVSACGGKKEETKPAETNLSDGYFQAIAQTADNGWTNYVTFDVKDGKIANFDYDSVNLMTGNKKTKSEAAAAGEYNLAEGNAGSWDKQIEAVEKYVVENQTAKDIDFNEEGKSDTVAGATVSYGDVQELIDAAIKAGDVSKGSLTDGVYFAEDASADDKGFKFTLGYVVKNGVILGAYADAYKMATVEGKETKQYKNVMARAGEYDLAEGNIGSYDVQAKAVSDYLVKNQKLDVEVNAEGKTDAISGATITVSHWITLFTEVK